MSRLRRRRLPSSAMIAAALIAIALSSLDLSAQSTFATLTGTVADPSSAVLPGVTVTVTNQTTGLVRTTSTSSSGQYQIPTSTPAPMCCNSGSAGSPT